MHVILCSCFVSLDYRQLTPIWHYLTSICIISKSKRNNYVSSHPKQPARNTRQDMNDHTRHIYR